MEPVPRTLLRDRVYETILDAIVRREIKPGDRLVEYRIARDLNVSQAPVREAIQRLSAEGLIVTQRHSIARLRLLRREDLKDVYEIRELLECIAAERAAAKPVTQEEIAKLEDLVEQMRSVGRSRKVTDWVPLDMAFHLEIARLSGSAALTHALTPLLAQIGAFAGSRNLAALEDPQLMASAHDAIIAALRGGDPTKARQAIKDHVQLAWRGVLKVSDEDADHQG